MTSINTRVRVTVRYFGAARAASGVDAEPVTVDPGTSVAGLAAQLAAENARLATVLARCSYLCDGVAVRNATDALSDGQTVDVLPPFAGG
jgi:molybdopterin converting factor small subunit